MVARAIRSAPNNGPELVSLALYHLRRARYALRLADAPRAIAKVRQALASTEGAQRHMHHRMARSALPSPKLPRRSQALHHQQR